MVFRRFSQLFLLLGLMLGLSLIAVSVQAQTPAPRYRLTFIDGGGITQDQCNVRFSVGINNSGSVPTETVQLVLNSPVGVLTAVDVPPVNTDATVLFEVIGSRQLIPEGAQLFTLSVQLDGRTYGDTPALQQNLTIPALPTACTNTPISNSFPVVIPFLNIKIDLLNPTVDEMAFLGGLIAALLLILLLPLMVLRRLTRRPPTFGGQLPPYATTPPLDPNSEAGVRQSWQLAAQNNLISVNPSPQAMASVKMLTGADGQYLDGWDLTAIRLSQYDQYGRVTRSVTLADAGVIRALNRLAHNQKLLEMPDLEKRATQIEKKVTPLGRKLADALGKRITARSAVLPIALDLRFRGEHGEVKIIFQLYRCGSDSRTWGEVQSWEPEMVVTTGMIYEMYTYTLHGQTQNESLKDFKRRLPLEISRMLGEFIAPSHAG